MLCIESKGMNSFLITNFRHGQAEEKAMLRSGTGLEICFLPAPVKWGQWKHNSIAGLEQFGLLMLTDN